MAAAGFSGCASDASTQNSQSVPWTRRASWEGSGMPGMGVGH